MLLHGDLVGTLTRAQGDRVTFAYDDAYRQRRDATPLSLSMPLAVAEHENRVVSPFIENLFPERPEVLERWARAAGVSAKSLFDLLAYVGEDCAGAARYVLPERREEALTTSSVDWLTPADIAEHLRRLRVDPAAWHIPPESGGFSLAGVQAKVALLFDGERWGRPRGRMATTHILKPAIPRFVDQDVNEHLCLRLCARLGIPASTSSVMSFDDERVIVVERYDRVRSADGWRRVHQEDMCQSLGLPPARKYENERGPGVSDVARLLREYVAPERARWAIERFRDALIVSWLISAPDGHAKNYSVLLAGRQVRLAPLYDINSLAPYPEFDFQKSTLAMRIGKRYRITDITRTDWERCAATLGMDGESVVERIRELAVRIPDELATLTRDPEIVAMGSRMPSLLLDGVTTRVAMLAPRLDRASKPLPGHSRQDVGERASSIADLGDAELSERAMRARPTDDGLQTETFSASRGGPDEDGLLGR